VSEAHRTVSVVIPVFNGAATLPAAIASVRRQTHPALEILVIDDGSTDATPQIIQSLAAADLRPLHQANGGASSARNAGIRAARGDLIAFLDADDEWLPEKLARQVEYMASHPEIDLVYTLIEQIDDDGRVIGIRPLQRGHDDYAHLFHSNRIPTSSVLARREALLGAGLFDESIRVTQDYDMWLRIAARGRFAGIPETLARYRYRAGISRDVETVYLDHLDILDRAPLQPECGVDGVARERARALYRYRLGQLYARQRRWGEAACMFAGVVAHPMRYGLRRRGPADHRVRFLRSLRFYLICQARASLASQRRRHTAA